MSDHLKSTLSPEAESRLREAQSYVKSNLNNKNQQVIEQDLWTPNKIYLEFSLCKDYTLGCVYFLLARDPRFKDCVQDVLSKIKANLSVWQDRVFDDFDRIYPDLPIRSADIDAVMADQASHDEIFRLAPNTVFYVLFRDDLYLNINHTHVRGKFTKIFIDGDGDNSGRHVRSYDDIVVMINTYPLTLSEKVQPGIARFFANLYGVDVSLISRDPSGFTAADTWLKQIEQYYISKIGQWTKSPFIKEQFYESIGYIERHMAAIPLTDPRMAKIISSNPAWFKDCKMQVRALFDKEFRKTIVGSDPTIAMEGVLNHLCLFVDMTWIPTMATRFTLPPKEESRTEELSDQMLDALDRFKRT